MKLKTLIVGAGEAGRLLCSDFKKKGIIDSVVGFVDDDAGKWGKEIDGIIVLDSISNIEKVIAEHTVDYIVIAMPSVPKHVTENIVSRIIKKHPHISIHLIPSVEKFFDTVPIAPSLEEIPFAELFERDELTLDLESIQKTYEGKCVMITGAGGSIGSEICRQLLKFKIGKLIAVGRGEYSIYNLINSLNEFLGLMDNRIEVVYKIADVKDIGLLEQIYEKHRPDMVFHTAAHKHVPLMEENEIEAIQNNVGGTLNVLQLSKKYNVQQFILISTDKAVNPVSIMGATKRISEMLTEYYYNSKKLNSSIVRFGNVMGSRGSVIPLFRKQIEKGGPVTVTDPAMTRYFMSIPEASLLVINAATYGEGGELFVLDMGDQYKIDDIARKLVEFFGYKPDVDIKIAYTGLRPGEKIVEELFYDSEMLLETKNNKIFILNSRKNNKDEEKLKFFIESVLPNTVKYSSKQIRESIQKLVPEYSWDAESLDSKSKN